MGSTNTGRLTDYPGSSGRAGASETPGGPAGMPSAGDPGGGDDRCALLVEHQLLEEVERCPYFERTGDVPPVGTDVLLLGKLAGGRLAVATLSDEEVLGYLPTTLNYLLACMKSGWRYNGEVVASVRQHIAAVRVELRPSR